MSVAYDLFTYPQAAGHKGRDTGRAAAEGMSARAPRLRKMCLDELSEPLTADQCAVRLGIDKLSIRPRFSELAATGAIIDTGERRQNASGKSAIVWRKAT
jgi:hypothetical protein